MFVSLLTVNVNVLWRKNSWSGRPAQEIFPWEDKTTNKQKEEENAGL